MTYLISAESLADEGADCIFDCSFSLADALAGRAQFEQGHIPGALYVDLNRDLSEPPDHRGRHPMPDRGTFAQRVCALGVIKTQKSFVTIRMPERLPLACGGCCAGWATARFICWMVGAGLGSRRG